MNLDFKNNYSEEDKVIIRKKDSETKVKVNISKESKDNAIKDKSFAKKEVNKITTLKEKLVSILNIKIKDIILNYSQ